jgi:hypothetical protein
MTHYEYRGLPLTFENVHYEVSEALEMASWNDDENNIIDPSDPHHPFDYENNNWAIDLTEVELYLLVRDGYVMVDGPLYPVKYLIEKLRENRCNFEILHEIDQPGLSGV